MYKNAFTLYILLCCSPTEHLEQATRMTKSKNKRNFGLFNKMMAIMPMTNRPKCSMLA